MNAKRIDLQTRDHLLLRYLCDFGYLTFHQIESKVLRCHKKRALRRLKKLRDAGLIVLLWRKDGVGSRVYSASLKHVKCFVDASVYERAILSNSLRSALNGNHLHEDIVRDVALSVLQIIPEGTFELEHHMVAKIFGYSSRNYSRPDYIPDIQFTIFDNIELSIEIELTLKSRTRYFKKFNDLQGADTKVLLYVVGRPNVGETILDIYSKVAAHPKIPGRQLLPKLFICTVVEATDPNFLRTFISTHFGKQITSNCFLHEGNPEDFDLRVESEARKLGA